MHFDPERTSGDLENASRDNSTYAFVVYVSSRLTPLSQQLSSLPMPIGGPAEGSGLGSHQGLGPNPAHCWAYISATLMFIIQCLFTSVNLDTRIIQPIFPMNVTQITR